MCGCKDRGKLLAAAARNAAKGNIKQAQRNVRVASASAGRDVRNLAQLAKQRVLSSRPR